MIQSVQEELESMQAERDRFAYENDLLRAKVIELNKSLKSLNKYGFPPPRPS